MRLMEVASIVFYGLLFRGSGALPVGLRLVDALASEDETVRGLAATMIVRAGPKACPTLREAAREERSLPIVLSMLGDLGETRDEGILKDLSVHHDAQVQLAAKDALDVLQARHFVH
ncbi:MAG: hypothetical protein ACQGVC_11845 [Myxococcota bacterium]